MADAPSVPEPVPSVPEPVVPPQAAPPSPAPAPAPAPSEPGRSLDELVLYRKTDTGEIRTPTLGQLIEAHETSLNSAGTGPAPQPTTMEGPGEPQPSAPVPAPAPTPPEEVADPTQEALEYLMGRVQQQDLQTLDLALQEQVRLEDGSGQPYYGNLQARPDAVPVIKQRLQQLIVENPNQEVNVHVLHAVMSDLERETAAYHQSIIDNYARRKGVAANQPSSFPTPSSPAPSSAAGDPEGGRPSRFREGPKAVKDYRRRRAAEISQAMGLVPRQSAI